MNILSHTPRASRLVLIPSLCFGLCLALPALAQTAATNETERDENAVTEEVFVTGLRRSLENALEVKKSSEHVVEALDLADIDAIPDVTIADAIVRLPGVNGARDRGNQSQAAIRGLGPRMVFGTVNGREVASSEPGRSIRFEQYPSELITAVQVYKTQSADLIAGGIAGTVNLETVKPLDYAGPTYSLRAGLVYYDGGEDIPDYDPLGNRFSGSIVKEVNDKFGFALGFTSQLQKNAYPSYQAWGFNTGSGDQTNLPAGGGDLTGNGDFGYVPWGIQTEVKKLETQRDGLMGALQFRPSDALEITYDALFTEFHLDEEQNQTWYQNIGNWDNSEAGGYSDVVIQNNRAVAASVNQWTGDLRHVIAGYDQTNSVLSHGLNLEYTGLDNWIIEADLSYSDAERENYWNAIYLDEFGHSFSYDLRDPSVTVPTDSPAATPETATFGLDDWNEGSALDDKMTTLQLDFNRRIDAGHLASIDFGVRVSDREKEVIWTEYNISGPLGLQWSWDTQIPADISDGVLSSYTVDEIRTSPYLNVQSYNALADDLFGGSDFSEDAEVNESRYWKVAEDNSETYFKANFSGELGDYLYSANAGLRVVKITTESYSYDGASVENDNTEVLPSATLNLNLSDDRILRVGIARALSRPPLDELRAGEYISVINSGTGNNIGNPNLDPFTSDQIDVAYEWYFAPESLLALAMYYKKIENYVGYTSFDVPTGSGQPATIWAPTNSEDSGSINGVELTFQRPLFAGFGIYSNYAYADSDIKEFAPENNPYPMAGLAEHTATVDLWYSQGGFEGRLGWKYHSGYTTGFEWDGSALRHLDSEENVGLSLAYALNDNLSFRMQANNLTNQELRLSQNNEDRDLRRYDVYGRTYLFDVTWKM